MNYEDYRDAYFADPMPESRYHFKDSFGVTLYFEEFDSAVSYYSNVLGPPAYSEGEDTRGWPIESSWLTLLKGSAGSPRNVEVSFMVDTADEAERLQRDFIEAGGEGPKPSDQLMYQPIRFCAVKDPFGTELLIISPLR